MLSLDMRRGDRLECGAPARRRRYAQHMFEGVDPKVLGAVRALARELRFRTIEPIIGRRVRIESVGSIDSAVRTVVPELPANARLLGDDDNRSATLAQYGLLDLRYEVDSIAAP